MPERNCPYPQCTFKTEDVTDALAAEILAIHRVTHTAPATSRKGPKVDPPKVSTGISEEVWNVFSTRWSMFKRGTTMTPAETVQQLFQCCSDELGDAILRGHPSTVAETGTEQALLDVIKKLAVIPVARVVRRMDLLSLKQDHGESVRNYLARITGKASTCGYTMACSGGTCNVVNDFTSVIAKDILVHGLVDGEIRKDVVGWTDVDEKTVEETAAFIEGKEMARDSIATSTSIAAAPISHVQPGEKGKSSGKLKEKTKCSDCNAVMDKYFYHHKRKKNIECTKCKSCWQKEQSQKPANNNQDVAAVVDETSALLIGAMSNSAPQKRYRLYGVNVPDVDPSLYYDAPPAKYAAESSSEICSGTDTNPQSVAPVVLDHHIFDNKNS